MARLKLIPDPTFTAKVAIPVPGKEATKVEFTFKHRTRDEVDTFLKNLPEEDVKLILAVATGWELVDEFSPENIGTFVQHYIAAPKEVFETYLQELTGARRKN